MSRRTVQRIAPVLYCICLTLAPTSALWAAAGCPVEPGIAPPTAGEQPSLTADKARLGNNGMAQASGNVRLEKGTQALEAPQLSYDRHSSRVLAPEGLRYYRPGVNLQARHADVVVDDETGILEGAGFSLIDNGGRGSADKIKLAGPGRFRLNGASYTTCPLEETPAWLLTADEIDLDQDSGRGEAYDAVLRLHDWPVFYTPYINFPIDDKRHSGLLVPTIGHSSNSGFELATPYYFNLAPDRDATVTPRLLSDRGLQMAGEFRYLNEHSKGRAVGEYLPSDNQFGNRDRSLVQLQHIGRLDAHVGLQADYARVSDDQYFDDLGSSLSDTSQSQLEQSLRLGYAATGVRLSVLARAFQTLDENNTPGLRTDPYEELPQLRLALLSPTAPWRAGMDFEAAEFSRDDSVEGRRYDLRPRLLWETDHSGWYLKSEAAYRYTRYNLDNPVPGADQILERDLPSFSAEAGLRFERVLDNGWLQTLEPRVFYLYNGYESQNALPVFDTGIPDLHFERLFADNRFVGTDRIGDANQVTLGLTSRFLDPTSGRTVVKLDIGRIYGFRDLRVRLPMRRAVGFGERNSDIVANLEYAPLEQLHTGLTLQYDPGGDRVDRSTLRLGYHDDAGRRLDLGYRLYRDFRPMVTGAGGFETLEQTDVMLHLPIRERLALIGRWNYSLEKSQTVEALAGLEYRPSCCWALRTAWRRYVNNDQDPNSGTSSGYNNAIMMQIELTGLGRFGDDIQSVLQRDIVDVDSASNRLSFR